MAIGFFVALFGLAAANGQCNPAAGAVALIGDTCISAAHLEREVRAQLLLLREEEYRVKLSALKEIIAKRLLGDAAAKRGVDVERFIAEETERQVGTVEAAGPRRESSTPLSAKNGPVEPSALEIVRSSEPERVRRARERFIREEMQRRHVQVWLSPPRTPVSTSGSAVHGADGAPISIVEFVDFECPYSRTMAMTLEKVLDTYPGKVRLVSRHFPLSFHEHATVAAEAAECARDQGRYWEFRKLLFDQQPTLSREALRQYAAEIRLDTAAFEACVNAGQHQEKWRGDLADGRAYGVTGTPTVFVNGRIVRGTPPVAVLEDIVEEELAVFGPPAVDPKR